MTEQTNCAINYQALLKKYMQHICDCEGGTFVNHIGSYADCVTFTDEEKKVLEVIEEGLWND